MAKISTLPPVEGPLTGTEPVVLVQDGETRQGPIGALVEQVAQPFVDQAEAIRASLADAFGNLVEPFTIGRPVDPIDGAGLTGGTYVYRRQIAGKGRLKRLRAYLATSSIIKVRRFVLAGTDYEQVGSDLDVAVDAGFNSVDVAMEVEGAEYIGFYAINAHLRRIATTADSDGYSLASLTDTGTVPVGIVQTGQQLQIGFDFDLDYVTTERVKDTEAELARAIPIFRDGSVVPLITYSAINGSAIVLQANQARNGTIQAGLSIPSGGSGSGSFANVRLPLLDPEFALMNGRRLIVRDTYRVTGTWSDRLFTRGVAVAGSANCSINSFSYAYDGESGTVAFVFDLTIDWTPGDAAATITPFWQATAVSALAADMALTIVNTTWAPFDRTALFGGERWQELSARKQAEFERRSRQYPVFGGRRVVTANAAAGSGADFTGLQAIQNAIDSITDASADKEYEIRISGVFTPTATTDYTKTVTGIATFIVPKPYVHLAFQAGAGIIASVPDVTPSKELFDLMRFDADCEVSGGYLHSVNIRYGSHFETAGNGPNIRRVLRGMHIKCGPNPALGYGGSGGDHLQADDCIFETEGSGAVYMHDNTLAGQGAVHDLRRCEFRVGANNGRALQLQSLGERQVSLLRLTDPTIHSGDTIAFLDNWVGLPMLDHCSIRLTAPGHEPRAVDMSDMKANALLIASATTGLSSSVVMDQTSSAFEAIFGDAGLSVAYEGPLWRTHQHGYERVAGGVGLAGFAISGIDIGETNRGLNGGHYMASLGKRLGDCSSINKVLTVTVDGGSPINITFDKNYDGTGSNAAPNYSNAAILAEINTALGATATASLIAYGSQNFPLWKGNETRINADATAIIRGMGVIITARDAMRIATSADVRIDGIAIDSAAPGKRARLITCGEIYTQNSGQRFALREVSSIDHAVGAMLGIDAAAPGIFSAAGPVKVLRVVAGNVAAWIQRS